MPKHEEKTAVIRKKISADLRFFPLLQSKAFGAAIIAMRTAALMHLFVFMFI